MFFYNNGAEKSVRTLKDNYDEIAQIGTKVIFGEKITITNFQSMFQTRRRSI